MALSDSALSELLDALRVGDGTDLVRESAHHVAPPGFGHQRRRHRPRFAREAGRRLGVP